MIIMKIMNCLRVKNLLRCMIFLQIIYLHKTMQVKDNCLLMNFAQQVSNEVVGEMSFSNRKKIL